MKPVEGYEKYTVSDQGIIYGHKGIPRKWYYNNRGYCLLSLYKNGVGKMFTVHRIVAIAFVPNPKSLPCVNHKNGNKEDNRAENLEWITYKDNTRHAMDMGLLNHKGENHAGCKVSDKEVSEMREIYNSGGITLKEISDAYGLSLSHGHRIIKQIRRGELT